MTAEFEILAVLNRYLHGVDTRDRAQVAACFTEDAEAFYHGADARRSRAEILDLLDEAGAFSGAQVGASIHALASWSIDVMDAASAVSSSMVEAVHVDLPRGTGQGVRRGLRYTDELRRTSTGWLICRRRHELLWSYPLEGATLAAS